jgi:hypothetical protein
MALMRTPQGRATPIEVDTEFPRFENKKALCRGEGDVDVSLRRIILQNVKEIQQTYGDVNVMEIARMVTDVHAAEKE